jgi:hypothetical protein
MQVLRSLLPWGIKRVNWGLGESLLRCFKRPLFASVQTVRDAMLNRHVPIGYEDETGFHYGVEADRSEDGGCRLQQPGGAIVVAERGTAGPQRG